MLARTRAPRAKSGRSKVRFGTAAQAEAEPSQRRHEIRFQMQFSVGNWTSSQKRPSNVHQLGTPYHQRAPLPRPLPPCGRGRPAHVHMQARGGLRWLLACRSCPRGTRLAGGCNEVDAASLRTLLSCQRMQRGHTSGGRVAKEKPRRPDRSLDCRPRERSIEPSRTDELCGPVAASPRTDDGCAWVSNGMDGMHLRCVRIPTPAPLRHENAPRLMSITLRPTIGRQSNTDGAREEKANA